MTEDAVQTIMRSARNLVEKQRHKEWCVEIFEFLSSNAVIAITAEAANWSLKHRLKLRPRVGAAEHRLATEEAVKIDNCDALIIGGAPTEFVAMILVRLRRLHHPMVIERAGRGRASGSVERELGFTGQTLRRPSWACRPPFQQDLKSFSAGASEFGSSIG